tara:strand:+ start:643 stop:1434 length:792 start_codon:yes stop_codon:yes gene_type:complete
MFNKELNIKLDFLKNKYKNKSAIVFGNGPSISTVNFQLIKKNKNIVTFTTNQIADICIKQKWSPDLYTAFFCEPLRGKKYKLNFIKSINYSGSYENALIAQKNIKYILNNNSTECFLNNWYKVFLNKAENSHFIKPVLWDRFKEFPINAFEIYKLPDQFLWNCATTPLFQLCFNFEFKNIAIIGQDGYFKSKSNNHFDGYVGSEPKDEKIMDSANNRISKLFDACKYYANKRNIKMYNLSINSKFNQFKKISLEEYISIAEII